MTLKLLRLEAINLSYVVDDTEDLSTRRGGGYMLLQAVRDLTKSEEEFEEKSRAFKYRGKINPISTGASIGLFEISESVNNDELIQEVHNYLHKNPAYRHATFAVEIVQGEDFRILVEQTISKVRWHQMQSLNFSTLWSKSEEICKTDEIRPAASSEKYKGQSTSCSVWDRSTAGRELRQDFYSRELDQESTIKFTDNTESLSHFKKNANGYKNIPFNLNGKMAVFYADGNNFGKIQRRCATIKSVKEWDSDLKNKRKKLLAELLQFLSNTPLGNTNSGSDNNELRIETLLWGGDEVLFLIPAWLGLIFTENFFEITKGWKDINGENLTHAAGLVFASHAAPISQLQKLAKKLADYGKATDKTQNTVSWIVLESFDHAGDNMDDYWQRSGIAQNGWQQLLLTQEKLTQLRTTLIESGDNKQRLKDALPRSAIVRVLRSQAAGKADEEIDLLRRSYESVDAAIKEAGKNDDFTRLWKLITHNAWQIPPDTIPPEDAVAWTLLMELWDYILPDVSEQTGGDQ